MRSKKDRDCNDMITEPDWLINEFPSDPGRIASTTLLLFIAFLFKLPSDLSRIADLIGAAMRLLPSNLQKIAGATALISANSAAEPVFSSDPGRIAIATLKQDYGDINKALFPSDPGRIATATARRLRSSR